MNKIAVIGCGGFIGVHLVERLLELGYEVDGWDLDDHRLAMIRNHAQFHFHHTDYSSAHEIDDISSHQIVIHLAALCNPSLYNTQDELVISSNFMQPATLVQACVHKGSWLIFFSTCEVYGRTLHGHAETAGVPFTNELQRDQIDLLREDSPILLGSTEARRWSYASAKQLLERYLIGLAGYPNFRWTVVRPFNFLGPAMDFIPGIDGEGLPRVMACFMHALLNNQPLSLVDGGKNRRCFTWIGDAVEAIVAILEHPEKARNQCFNIGNPQNEIDMRGLAERMCVLYTQITGKTAPGMVSVSSAEFYGAGYEDSDRRLPDVSKALRLLGWKPHTSLDITLQRTVEWFLDKYQEHS